MARVLCPQCEYPKGNCLCEFLTPASHQTQVVVLQHPSEVKNAKNTVRLLNLISDNATIIVGESEQDFAELRQQVTTNTSSYAVLFPCEEAMDLNELETNSTLSLKHLIVIDGTWKKAKKILMLNPWLNDITKVSFTEELDSNYRIRSTTVDGGLSTIEAVAYALNKIEGCATAPFIRALNGLTHSFTKRMPEQIKARYQQRE